MQKMEGITQTKSKSSVKKSIYSLNTARYLRKGIRKDKTPLISAYEYN